MNLEEIRARLNRGIVTHNDAAELLAEVDRLRAEQEKHVQPEPALDETGDGCGEESSHGGENQEHQSENEVQGQEHIE